MIEVKFKLTGNNNIFRATAGSAGFDLSLTNRAILAKGHVGVYGTGVHWEPEDTNVVGLVIARSSLYKYGVQLANAVGVIDSDYRGEIMLPLIIGSWCDDEEVVIDAGDRLAQLIILPAPEVKTVLTNSLNETFRWTGSFGSTGR